MKKRILVISPLATDQMYLGIIFKRIGYRPVLAKSAIEGVLLSQKESYSLIILDGDLMDNELFAAITLLKANPFFSDPPLIIFVTTDSLRKKELLISQGCTAVVTKPHDLSFVYSGDGRLTGHPRSGPRASIWMRVEIEEGTPEKYLVCANLSESGMYLRTRYPLPEKSILHPKFTLPYGTDELTVQAEVVRCVLKGVAGQAGPGMGVRFVNISEKARQQIRNFIQWEKIGDLDWEPGKGALESRPMENE